MSHGGGLYVAGGSAFVTESFIRINQSEDNGGGIGTGVGVLLSLNRCVVAENECQNGGGGIFNSLDAIVSVSNSNIVENQAAQYGGHFVYSEVPPTVLNCIVWGNTGTGVQAWGTITYSDIQGGYPGIGNIHADPMFVNAVNGDFHLSEQSPCIDSGDPEFPKDSDSTRADMGAYQFVHTKLMASPAQLNFGLIDLGTDSTMQIELFNPTAAPISVEGVSNVNSVFSFDTVGLDGQVAPFSAYDLNVLFAPSLSGTHEDTLDITTGQSEDSVIRVPLWGEARVILPPVDSLVAQKGPLNGIRLDWAAVTHSITGQPVQDVIYIIYGSTSSDGPFVPFGYSTTNNYVHAFILNTQSEYFYQVTADLAPALARHGSGLLPNVENK